MSYNVETQQVSAQFVNSNFIKKIEDGRIKEAEAEGSAFVREYVRQESYAREIINPVLLQDDEVDRDENTDEPKKIIEKEPKSVATFVQFQGAGPRTWFKGPRYSVYFGKVESQHFTKSKFQLMTYQNDIRKIISDNSVKDLADQEDKKFQDTIDELVSLNSATAAGQTTKNPAFNARAAFSANTFKRAFQSLVGRKRPLGKMTMTKGTYYEALELDATAVGMAVATRHYDEGVEGEDKLWGIPVVTTIKNDIHDEAAGRNVYIYAPESYLGNFFLLQDATLYIKQEADMISFWTYAAPGIGIGNRLSIQKIELV
jgi:hypothetical protein